MFWRGRASRHSAPPHAEGGQGGAGAGGREGSAPGVPRGVSLRRVDGGSR